uniref:MAM domain-containing protein n=1 Tax=Oryzias sinensis TaxID=183150 RepID=A0A8C7ZTM2_9TELE
MKISDRGRIREKKSELGRFSLQCERSLGVTLPWIASDGGVGRLPGLSAPKVEQKAGCSFDSDSDPGLCEYRQGQEDDFDWQLIRTYNWPHPTTDLLQGSFMMVNSSQHFGGQRAQLHLLPLSENDTHCIQFSYFLYSRDGHSPGALHVYVRVNGGPKGSAVWNASGSQGRQWHQVELAVSTFWPSEYQVSLFGKHIV